MNFTKEQLSTVLGKHIEREHGLQELMELMIESMMHPSLGLAGRSGFYLLAHVFYYFLDVSSFCLSSISSSIFSTNGR